MSARGWVAHCPAKVNLTLRILDRRADGYHEIETVFQSIGLWDRLEAWPDSGLSLSVAGDARGIPEDASNLVLRAADLLGRRQAPSACGVRFRLVKSIPIQAGLGGGSSNAAGALLLCARLWDLPSGTAELAALAAELGADVPFFLRGGTALGRGRGECVEALAPVRELALVLGTPAHGCATAEVYRDVASVLTLPRNGVSLPPVFAHKWPEQNDFAFMANDLEAVVFPRWPELARFRDALLEAGARVALLCGSGSSVYGIFDDADGLVSAAAELPGRFPTWRIRATRSIRDGVRVEVLG